MKKLSEIGTLCFLDDKIYRDPLNSHLNFKRLFRADLEGESPTSDANKKVIMHTPAERRKLVRAAIAAWELFSENLPSVPEAELEEFLEEQGI